MLRHKSGLKIHWGKNTNIFPKRWENIRINVLASPLVNYKPTLEIILSELKKYPINVISDNICNIYLMKSLSFKNITAGGTNSRSNIYIANMGVEKGYSDSYIKTTFHHEIA